MSDLPLRQSAIADYLSCPRKAQLRYLDKISTPNRPAPALGTSAHRGIEWAYRHRLEHGALPPAEAVAEATSKAAHETIETVDFTDAPDERGPFVDRAIALATHYVTHVAPSIDVVDVEHRFAVVVRGLLVEGTIDVVERRGVRDTKTTHQHPSLWGSPTHRFQLGLYALAIPGAELAAIDYLQWSERTGRATKSEPFPARTRDVRHLPVLMAGDELRAESELAAETIERVAYETTSGDYPRNPTACAPYGKACEYLSVCMPWRASAAERAYAIKKGLVAA